MITEADTARPGPARNRPVRRSRSGFARRAFANRKVSARRSVLRRPVPRSNVATRASRSSSGAYGTSSATRPLTSPTSKRASAFSNSRRTPSNCSINRNLARSVGSLRAARELGWQLYGFDCADGTAQLSRRHVNRAAVVPRDVQVLRRDAIGSARQRDIHHDGRPDLLL